MRIGVFTRRGDNSGGYQNSHHPRCMQSIVSIFDQKFPHSLTYDIRVHIDKITKLLDSDVFSSFHFFEDSQLDHDIETGKDCELSRAVSTEPAVEATYKDTV